MRIQNSRITILIVVLVMICLPQVLRADRAYDDSTKKLIENVKSGADHFKDKVQDKFKVEKITRNGVTTDVSDALDDWKKSAETMNDRFKSDYAANPDALEFLKKSKKLEDFMNKHQGQTGADTEWYQLRGSLMALATAYNIDWQSDPEQWKPSRVTDNELKAKAAGLEQALKAFDKNLDQAMKTMEPNSKKDIETSKETLAKAAKMLKNAIEDKKPAGGALDSVTNAANDLSSKLESAGLTSQVSSAWSGVQNALGSLASAFGRNL